MLVLLYLQIEGRAREASLCRTDPRDGMRVIALDDNRAIQCSPLTRLLLGLLLGTQGGSAV